MLKLQYLKCPSLLVAVINEHSLWIYCSLKACNCIVMLLFQHKIVLKWQQYWFSQLFLEQYVIQKHSYSDCWPCWSMMSKDKIKVVFWLIWKSHNEYSFSTKSQSIGLLVIQSPQILKSCCTVSKFNLFISETVQNWWNK